MPNKIVKKTSSGKPIATLKAIGDDAALEESQARSENRETNPVAIAALLPAVESRHLLRRQDPGTNRRRRCYPHCYIRPGTFHHPGKENQSGKGEEVRRSESGHRFKGRRGYFILELQSSENGESFSRNGT